MKTLVIPDVHEQLGKVRHLEVTLFPKADRVVFLGDWWDSFGPRHSAGIAKWVKARLGDSKYTFLLGNHDVSYAFGMHCSGYEQRTADAIAGVMTPADWRLFKVYAEVEGVLLSHAGFRPLTDHLIDPDVCAMAIELGVQHTWSPMWTAGRFRGGRGLVGGPVWLDWNGEFQPIPERPQIVGHTFDYAHKPPQVRQKAGGNYCIDTGLRHVAWITDGVVSTEEVTYDT